MTGNRRRANFGAHVAAGLAALALTGAGCGNPKLSVQAMAQQPRYEALEGAPELPEAQSAQPLVPGTVPRGYLADDTLLATGRNPDGTPSAVFPFAITAEDLARGQRGFNDFCVPCHDAAGTGQGNVVLHGYSPPPSLHVERLREAPAGHFFTVITEGHGQMPSYAEQIGVRERWEIVAYVRALQLSQNGTLDDVPAAERGVLEAAP
jgi:mono/diheme cytochrome c family protein